MSRGPSFHRLAIASLVSVTLLFGTTLPRKAAASPGSGNVVVGAMVLLEPVLPELRVELDTSLDDPVATIGLPLGVGLPYRLDPSGFDVQGTAGVFVEPQFQLAERVWRGLGGLEASIGHGDQQILGLLAEVGGVVGEDGSGGFVGVALVPFGQPEVGLRFCCLGWRALLTTEGTRHQLYLDLVSFHPGG